MKSGGREPGLDLVRIASALAVFVYHLDHFDVRVGWQLADQGNFGVAVFFALSGFLVYRPFLRGGVVPAAYLLRRLVRILPGAIVAVLVVRLALSGVTYWLALVLWSLFVEVAFYAVLPLLATIARRRELAVLSALGVASFLLDTVWPLGVGLPAILAPLALPFWLWAFVPGMLLAVLSRDHPQLIGRRSAVPVGVALVAAGLALGSGGDGYSSPAGVVAMIGGAALVMAGSVGARLPASRSIALAADATYPFYLYHAAILATLDPYFDGWALIATGFTVTAALSLTSVLLVETPIRRAFNARQDRRRAASEAATAATPPSAPVAETV